MKVELAYLRRMKYGRSSEKLEHPQPQLELVGGQVAAVVVEPPADAGDDDGLTSNMTSIEKERKKREPKTRPGLRELPEHLLRRTVVHKPQGGCDCAACGAVLREIGQDVSEVLDYEPGTFHASCAIFARSWPVRVARRSPRPWHQVGPLIVAWPALGCSRTWW